MSSREVEGEKGSSERRGRPVEGVGTGLAVAGVSGVVRVGEGNFRTERERG